MKTHNLLKLLIYTVPLLLLTCCNRLVLQTKKTFRSSPVRKSTANEHVQVLDTAVYMPQLDRYRRIWIYLPHDYHSTNNRYPVLYMHDGQNLFDNTTSFAGEWGVDETLAGMESEGFSGIIVVGIDNGGKYRMNEYSPWDHEIFGKGMGNLYMDFIVNTLKPMIDERFRTLSDARNTGIGGSSMGGLISFYAMLRHPSVFGRGLIYSPSFAIAPESYEFARNASVGASQMFYFLGGEKESDKVDVPGSVHKMIDLLFKNGLRHDQYHMVTDPDGKHNEAFWNKHFRNSIEFLFDNHKR